MNYGDFGLGLINNKFLSYYKCYFKVLICFKFSFIILFNNWTCKKHTWRDIQFYFLKVKFDGQNDQSIVKNGHLNFYSNQCKPKTMNVFKSLCCFRFHFFPSHYFIRTYNLHKKINPNHYLFYEILNSNLEWFFTR